MKGRREERIVIFRKKRMRDKKSDRERETERKSETWRERGSGKERGVVAALACAI